MSDDENRAHYNSSLTVMRGRLFGHSINHSTPLEAPKKIQTTSETLENQSLRLIHNGGYNQQDRMIYEKNRSLDRALLYSYQAAKIKKLSSDDIILALINPNKLKQDYDDKVLSVHRENNFKPGDVFEWLNTGTYWLIYLQDLTELAYFRGDIRKCSYQIAWEDEDGTHSTYAAMRGPVETKIDYIQKHSISVDNPNYSLNILLPNTEETLKYFQRYSKFYLQSESAIESKICWRVEAIDWISTPGILEVNATEYYSNQTDDDVENGIANGLLIEAENKKKSADSNNWIKGEGFIKPKKEYTYTFSGFKLPAEGWSISENVPVKLEVDESNGHNVHIKWTSSYSGQFTLSIGTYSKTIVVESLF